MVAMKTSLMIVLLMLAPCVAAAEETIVWFHSDFPPISIVYGPDKGRGAADQWEHYLIDQLGEFKHETMVANTARVFEEMKRRGNACNPAYIKTPEREQHFLFSAPIADLLPNGFITLQSRRPELEPFLNEKGELKLGELVAARRFRIGVANGRSFGVNIDRALREGNAPESVVPFAAHDIFSSGLVQVANQHGLDAVIGYAIELHYVVKRLKRDVSQFLFIPIAEDTTPILSHIACSKSPLGEKVIARINEVIRSGAAELAAMAYRSWLPPNTQDYYDKLRKSALRVRQGSTARRGEAVHHAPY